MLRRIAVSLAVVSALVVPTAGRASASNGGVGLGALRRATAAFRSVEAAERAGYGLFKDAAGIACIDMPGMGAMGIHYVNLGLVVDATEDPLKPEAMVYAPDDDGRLHLAAVEYVVFQKDWDAAHNAPPALFGQTFALTQSPNRFGLDPFYSLHVWAWKHNPAGTFAMWNPKVSCSPDDGHECHDHDGNVVG